MKTKIFFVISSFVFATSFVFALDCPNLTQNMRYGDSDRYKNGEVSQLQRFMTQKYGVDLFGGFFGLRTRSAVVKFQKENGLWAIGQVGPATRQKIREACAEQMLCNQIYQPVCGQTPEHECCTTYSKPSYCMYAKVKCDVGTIKTFGNSCELNNAKAKFLYDGECKTNTPPPTNEEPPSNCKVWYDGCNTCSRQSPGSPMACTLLYCFAHNTPYCKETF
jgi:hypothetical protein